MSIQPRKALWPTVPVSGENFQSPPREYGILPFWFLNGDLDPDQMRDQLKEFAAKGMPGDHPARPVRPRDALHRRRSTSTASSWPWTRPRS